MQEFRICLLAYLYTFIFAWLFSEQCSLSCIHAYFSSQLQHKQLQTLLHLQTSLEQFKNCTVIRYTCKIKEVAYLKIFSLAFFCNLIASSHSFHGGGKHNSRLPPVNCTNYYLQMAQGRKQHLGKSLSFELKGWNLHTPSCTLLWTLEFPFEHLLFTSSAN